METTFYADLNPYEQFDFLVKAYLVNLTKDEKELYLKKRVLPTKILSTINKNIFFNIPFHYGYRITMSGRVADLYKRIEVNPTINKTGYPAVTVTRDGGDRSITAHVHRLLALTFIPPPDLSLVHQLQVNHIDGDKTNFDLSNLEWVTQQRNCQHAYQTGLREDNTPIKITCANTGNHFTVYSMGEAGRFLNTHPATIHWQLNKRKTNGSYKGYYLEYANKTLVLQEVISG